MIVLKVSKIGIAEDGEWDHLDYQCTTDLEESDVVPVLSAVMKELAPLITNPIEFQAALMGAIAEEGEGEDDNTNPE